jgi:hypothetical protein
MATASAITAAKAFVEVGVKGTEESTAKMQKMIADINTSTKSIAASSKATAAGTWIDLLVKGLQSAAKAIRIVFNTIVSNVGESMERISNIVKRADRTGVSVGFMSSLQVMAIDSQVTLDEIEQSFAAFQRNMATAGFGVGEAKGALEVLKLDPKMLSDLGIEKALPVITAALAKIKSVDERRGLAMRLVGEQGRKLVPILTGNVELMETLAKESEYLGSTYSEEGARGVDDWRDSWKKLGLQLNSLWDTFTMQIAPIFSQIIDGGIIPFIHVMGELIGLLDDGGMGADFMSNAMVYLGLVAKGVVSVLVGVANSIARGFAIVLGMISEAFKYLSNAQEFFGADGTEAMKLSESWGGYRDSIEKSTAKVSAYMNNFYGNFDKAQKEWADLVAAERAATDRNIAEPAEDIVESVKELGEAFKGEALQRNASTMQRFQEMHLKNSNDIKEYVKKIAGLLGKSELLMAVE